ncbi:hypothetical protein Taro_021930 [Colocasia esculenta]|uniref:DUF8040 domain-containing protein n=1 Tax=Colocasia esculenta TaxID=4460 RepID=A0A843V055_COLES|nr:hypothetical protein [Colocasia esculenta]
MIRMNRRTFYQLYIVVRRRIFLHETIHIIVQEQLLMFLHTIAHNVRNGVMCVNYLRSGETLSRYFNHVLKALRQLHNDYIQPPDTAILDEIRSRYIYWPWFKLIHKIFFLKSPNFGIRLKTVNVIFPITPFLSFAKPLSRPSPSPLAVSLLAAIPLSAAHRRQRRRPPSCRASPLTPPSPASTCGGLSSAGGGLRRSFPCLPLLLLLPFSNAFPKFVVHLRFIPIDLRRDVIRFGALWRYLLIGVVLLIMLLLLLLAYGGRG